MKDIMYDIIMKYKWNRYIKKIPEINGAEENG